MKEVKISENDILYIRQKVDIISERIDELGRYTDFNVCVIESSINSIIEVLDELDSEIEYD